MDNEERTSVIMSLSEVVNNLYNEFVELKERQIATDTYEDSLFHVNDFGTGNIVICVFEEENSGINLYLDLIALSNLGYKNIDIGNKELFENIYVSTLILSIDNEYQKMLLNRKIRRNILNSTDLSISLYEFCGLSISKNLIGSLQMYELSYMNYRYTYDNQITLKLNSYNTSRIDNNSIDIILRFKLLWKDSKDGSFECSISK